MARSLRHLLLRRRNWSSGPQNLHKMLGGHAGLPVIPELKTGARNSQDKLSNQTSPFCKFWVQLRDPASKKMRAIQEDSDGSFQMQKHTHMQPHQFEHAYMQA